MNGLTEGRTVHLVTSEREGVQHLAAIVTSVKDHEEGLVNLAVFSPDGGCYGVLSVPYSEETRAKTWHWIERS